MDQETVSMLAHKARHKIDFLNQSKLRYLVSAMFAGIFIGLGDILIFTVGGYLHDVHSPMTKIAVGMSFSVALSLIILSLFIMELIYFMGKVLFSNISKLTV